MESTNISDLYPVESGTWLTIHLLYWRRLSEKVRQNFETLFFYKRKSGYDMLIVQSMVDILLPKSNDWEFFWTETELCETFSDSLNITKAYEDQ